MLKIVLNSHWIILFILLKFVVLVNPLVCNVGYGQRGLLQKMGIQWTRECPHNINYCFEVTTSV